MTRRQNSSRLFFLWYLASALCLLPLCAPSALAAAHFAKPQGYVTDAAHVLDDATRQSLENQLSGFERSTSNEIAVVTTPSLEGETVEMYANELFSQWKIGKKGKDNGILILVAPTEHKARIEVGYGLEPVLPDGLCGQIIREQMLPQFKAGRYGPGIIGGAAAIQKVLEGQSLPAPAPGPSRTGENNREAILIYIVIILFIAFPYTFIFVAIALGLFYFTKSSLSFLVLLLTPLGAWLDLRYRRVHGGAWFGGIGSGGPSGGGFGGFGGGMSGGGGFGGFGGGMSGGGGASGGW